jgi:threonine dehydrogenase-like Zn-dependent dehydrogenase
VALGFFQGQAQELRLGEEFHHNRINIVCSQIGGRAPELQHRWDTLRLVHTFVKLAVAGDVDVQSLVTHRMVAADAPRLFALLDERPADVLQAVLDFREPLPATLLIAPLST